MASQSFIVTGWSSGWSGLGIPLIPGLVAESSPAYLVSLEYNFIGDFFFRTDLSQTGPGSAAGPNLTDTWETSAKAITLAYTDVGGTVHTIVLKGPLHPDIAPFQDEGNEPYQWSPDNFDAMDAWNAGAEGRAVTVTLDDGVIALRATLAPLTLGPISARLVAGPPHNLRATLAPLTVGPISARLYSRRPLRATLAPLTLGPLASRLDVSNPINFRATLAPLTLGPLDVRIRVFKPPPVSMQATLAPLTLGPLSSRLVVDNPISLRATLAPFTLGPLSARMRVVSPVNLRATLAPPIVGPLDTELHVFLPLPVAMQATLAPLTLGPLSSRLRVVGPPITLRATLAPLTVGPLSARLRTEKDPVLLRAALAPMAVGPIRSRLRVRTLPTAPRNLRIVLNAMGAPEATWDGPLDLGGGTLQRFALLVSDDDGQTYSEVDPTDLKLDRHHVIRVPSLEWHQVDAVPEATPSFPFILGIKRQIEGQPMVGQAIPAPWGAPFTVSRLGIQGAPGRPGYGAAFVYNDARVGMAGLVNGGDYQVIADVSQGGTLLWEDVKGAVQLKLYERDLFSVDRSLYLDTVVVGDVVVLSYAYDRWVGFEIRTREKIGGVYTFGVERVAVDESGGIGDIRGNVSVQFSRNNPFEAVTPAIMFVAVSAAVARLLLDLGRNDPLPAAAALLANQAFYNVRSRGPIVGDLVIFTHNSFSQGVTRAYDPITNSWIGLEQIFHGNLMVRGTILAHHLAAGTITAREISAEEAVIVGSTQIKDGVITSDHLQIGTITADKIVAGVIPGDLADLDGMLPGDRIALSSLTADQMLPGVIPRRFDQLTGLLGPDNIADAAIRTTKIAAGAVVAEKLAAGAVDLGSLVVHGVLQAEHIDADVPNAWVLFDGSVNLPTTERNASAISVSLVQGTDVRRWDTLLFVIVGSVGYVCTAFRVDDLKTIPFFVTGSPNDLNSDMTAPPRRKIFVPPHIGLSGEDVSSGYQVYRNDAGTRIFFRADGQFRGSPTVTLKNIIGLKFPEGSPLHPPGNPGTPLLVGEATLESSTFRCTPPTTGGAVFEYRWRAIRVNDSNETVTKFTTEPMVTFSAPDLMPNATYTIDVRAENASGNSDVVLGPRITTGMPLAPPGTPGVPMLTSSTDTSLTLTCTPPTTGSTPTRYVWRYSLDAELTAEDPIVTSPGPSVTIPLLTADTNYWIVVQARNAADQSSPFTSPPVQARTGMVSAAAHPPPRNLAFDFLAFRNGIVRFPWDAPALPSGSSLTLKEYRYDIWLNGVQIRTNNRFPPNSIAPLFITNALIPTPVQVGDTLRVRVKAVYTDGNESAYAENTTTLTQTTDTDSLYRLATSTPMAPTGGMFREEHLPTGRSWVRMEPDPTATENVYRVTRTRTYINGDFQSATAWENVTLVNNKTGMQPTNRPPCRPSTPVRTGRTATTLTLRTTPATGANCGPASSYKWRYSTDSILTDNDPSAASIGPTVTLTGLEPNTTYWVDVRGANGAMPGPYSAALETSTGEATPMDLPPGPPTNVSGMVSGRTVSVTFGAPSTGGPATRYEARYVAAGSIYSLGERSSPGTLSGLVPTGVSSTAVTSVSVRAGNANGEWSAWVDYLLATMTPLRPCRPSTPVRTGRTATTLTLRTTPDIAGANCGMPTRYRWRYGTNPLVEQNTGILTSTLSIITIPGLEPNTTYWIDVRAEDNDFNQSPYSTALETSTSPAPALAPGVPGTVTQRARTGESFSVGCEAPTSGGTPAGYDWQYSTDATVADPDPIVPSIAPFVTITELQPNTSYWVRVRARNTAGPGPYTSPPFQARTGAASPVISSNQDSIYRLDTVTPAAPTGGSQILAHEPSGWDRTEPSPTTTQNVYRATRTRFYSNGVFTHATNWGNVTLIASMTGGMMPTNVPPGVPTNVTAVRDGMSITYSWDPPVTGGAPTSYEYAQFHQTSGWLPTMNPPDGVLATMVTVTWPGTLSQTITKCRVRARNAHGTSLWVEAPVTS